MPKPSQTQGGVKAVFWIFFILTSLSLLAPLWVFKDLLFPYVTSKALYFRICIEAALPFYVFLLVAKPDLRPNFRKHPLNIAALVFVALNFVSAFSGVAVVRSLWGNFERMGGAFYIATLTLLYFYVLLIAQMGGSYLKRFLQIFLGVALVVTVNGIFGKLGWPTLVPDPSLPARVSSTLGNPIYVGSFLIIPMFVAMFLGSQAEEQFKSWSYYFFAFLFLIGIFLSGTRGANVGLIGGVFLAGVVYVALNKNRRVRQVGFALVGLFAVVAGGLFIFNSHLPANSDVRRLFTLKDSNTEARVIQWGVALKGYKDHPLFGVGPENYYIIANKYYNPAIFNYDKSWFDKPHNYPLEILVTDGAFGFLAYLAIFILMVMALYKGYKAGFLSLFEFSALLAALLAYQIQNLTVFDTIPASLTFYTLLGFCGYICSISPGEAGNNGNQPARKKPANGNSPLALSAFGVSVAVAVYLVYVTGIVPLEAAKAVNYGYAYASVDTQKSYDYFQRAMNLPFNFDLTESASKYAEAAVSVARAATPQNQAQAAKFVDGSITALNQALAVEPTYPILWMDLFQSDIYKGVLEGNLASATPDAETAIDKAIELSPIREEGYLSLAQLRAIEGRWTEAEQIITTLEARFPTDQGLTLQLATIYRDQGNTGQAAKIIEDAQTKGFAFTSFSDMQWLIDYDVSQKAYDKAQALIQAAEILEPSNSAVFVAAANFDLLVNKNQEAIALANQIAQQDPTQQKAMQTIIDQANKNIAAGQK